MEERNPYAPSRASIAQGIGPSEPGSANGAPWRDGEVLVTTSDASMPHRCVKCNEPADEPTKARKVYWHHPFLYLLILVNIILYAVIAYVVRKKAVVAPGLCVEHKKRRRRATLLGWIGGLSGVVLVYAGAASVFGIWAMSLGLVVSLGSIVAGVIFSRIVYVQKIDGGFVRLKGCGSPFLESLPPFSG